MIYLETKCGYCGGVVSIEEFGDGECFSSCDNCGRQADEHLNVLDTLYWWGVYWLKDNPNLFKEVPKWVENG